LTSARCRLATCSRLLADGVWWDLSYSLNVTSLILYYWTTYT